MRYAYVKSTFIYWYLYISESVFYSKCPFGIHVYLDTFAHFVDCPFQNEKSPDKLMLWRKLSVEWEKAQHPIYHLEQNPITNTLKASSQSGKIFSEANCVIRVFSFGESLHCNPLHGIHNIFLALKKIMVLYWFCTQNDVICQTGFFWTVELFLPRTLYLCTWIPTSSRHIRVQCTQDWLHRHGCSHRKLCTYWYEAASGAGLQHKSTENHNNNLHFSDRRLHIF